MNNQVQPESTTRRKIVVIGGRGLIGKQVVAQLRELGHEAVAASPSTGVNAVTGDGLDEALTGAAVVVDLANSPSFEDNAALAFFDAAGRNLAAAERRAGVQHHVALSVVGTDHLQQSGYFRAKLVQERHIIASGLPYTIVRATQFFEFIAAIAQAATVGDRVQTSTALMQPIAARDVAETITLAALAEPRNGIVELAGPEPIRINELVQRFLAAKGEAREIVIDEKAGYFGTPVDDRSLTPGAGAKLGKTRLADWLKANVIAG